jgi:hypothetical protein
MQLSISKIGFLAGWQKNAGFYTLHLTRIVNGRSKLFWFPPLRSTVFPTACSGVFDVRRFSDDCGNIELIFATDRPWRTQKHSFESHFTRCILHE